MNGAGCLFGWESNWQLPKSEPAADRLKGRTVPQLRVLHAPEGRYRVTVRLAADRDCDEVLVFVGRRQLAWRGSLKAGGSREIRTACAVAELIPEPGMAPRTPRGIYLAVVGEGVRITGFEAERDDAMPALILMGDSTVTEQPGDVPYAPGAVYAGWGQLLQARLGDRACVIDEAHSGLTCEAFEQEGHYDIVRRLVRPGDRVLIQFGHNDQKRIHLQAATGYRAQMMKYVRELRAQGAVPVLVTPLARNQWFRDGAYNDLLQAYAAQVLTLAQELVVPAIDLHGWMMDHLKAEGDEAMASWYHADDRTHLDDFGADRAADQIGGELTRLGLAPCEKLPVWPMHGPTEPLDAPVYDEKTRLTEAAARSYTLTARAEGTSIRLRWDRPVDWTPQMRYCVMLDGVMLTQIPEETYTLKDLQPGHMCELAIFDMPQGRMVAACRCRVDG